MKNTSEISQTSSSESIEEQLRLDLERRAWDIASRFRHATVMSDADFDASRAEVRERETKNSEYLAIEKAVLRIDDQLCCYPARMFPRGRHKKKPMPVYSCAAVSITAGPWTRIIVIPTEELP